MEKELAEKPESFRMELSKREESFRQELTETKKSLKKELSANENNMRMQLSQKETLEKGLSDSLLTAKQELSTHCERWERRAQQWSQEKRELEEMLLVKEKVWQHKEDEMKEDLHLLTQKNIQLRVCYHSSSFGFQPHIFKDFRPLNVK